MQNKFTSTFDYKLIYVFRINNSPKHKDLLKIGDATIHTDLNPTDLVSNCKLLEGAAKSRINQYTRTAGISYELLHTELAVYFDKKHNFRAFRDYDVKNVLINSGIKLHTFDTDGTQYEWYETDLETAKKAINAVKNNKASLNNDEMSKDKNPIVFRPDQELAIKKTIAQYKSSNNMLWNAKMRFGKTLTALQVAKKLEFKKIIILTHRPVVSDGWYEDFDKIFYDTNYKFGSKTKGKGLPIEELIKNKDGFVYFASIQDLRGSTNVGGKFEKNDIVFNIDWDFVVIDEAHEGTLTKLGEAVLDGIIKKDSDHTTKVLRLSGTPFNIIDQYKENEIYTWDYVMEQKAKKEWDLVHFGAKNPYDELPEMNIFTYDLNKIITNKLYEDFEDKAFNFREFFRTWTGEIRDDGKQIPPGFSKGDFVHKEDVVSFLNLITSQDENSNYPYSTKEYQNFFKHSLWIVPGVKEARALSKLMKEHPIFGSGAFKIVNVAGNGDEDEEANDAFDKVKKAIKDAGEAGYTITLSCGKLTTGVTVPQWTAVLMLAGSYATSASSYLQTVFRVQSPGNINGKIKEKCYVFDFAPDRTLKVVAEAAKLSTRAGANNESDKVVMGEFLNYCPVISIQGTRMMPYNVDGLLQQLKRAYVDKVVRNGFDDVKIYNDKLLQLDGLELKAFEELKKIIGSSKQTQKSGDIDVNNQGFTDEQYAELERIRKTPQRERTAEELRRLEELKEKNKNKATAISILRGISIRIPLMVYGAEIDINKEITRENFTNIVDDLSWEEFMPKGITKTKFKEFAKYYEPDIFIAAGRRIRESVKNADNLQPTERVKRLGEIFAQFKNPDKETVLTPWRVVNMHMSDCLGGYDFFDEEHSTMIDEPRFVDKGKVTEDTMSNPNAIILEINSKTGLYPLYVAYSLYTKKVEKDTLTLKDYWRQTVENNIFVVCKTRMARSITQRTLCGYKDIQPNILVIENIVEMMKNDSEKLISQIGNYNTWKIKKDGKIMEGKMKFNAIVGNPPYQEMISSNKDNSSLAKQLFPMFITNSIKLNSEYVSLITPSRWFTGDAQDKSFINLREFIKVNNHFSEIYNFPKGDNVFNNVVIKGGVNYFLYNKNYIGKINFYNCIDNKKTLQSRDLFENGLNIVLSSSEDYSIIKKVKKNNFISLTTITKGRNAFGIVGKQDFVDKISQIKQIPGYVKLQCKNEEIRWTDPANITKNIDVFKNYKVLISKSAGDPSKDTKIIGKPFIAEPFTACTDSLIPVGSFSNLIEANNLQKYMQSKFLRYMICILKTSQNVYQNVYQFVPLQNFTNKSDIDWSKSISDIDKQLYKKYNFTAEEVEMIENKIKPME